MVAETVEDIRRMIWKLKTYIENKGIEVNVGKTKITKCRKGGER